MIEDRAKQVANKPDQIWMQVKQAHKKLEKEISKIQGELEDFRKKVKNLSYRLEAMDEAKNITKEELESYTLEELRDIFTEDDEDSRFERMVLGYLSAGEMCYIM